MFKILKNQNATSTDLAETYIRAVELGEKLTAEKGEIHKKLMELQVAASFDAKPDKKLLSLKTQMDALIIQLDACRFGQQQLKTRIGEALQKEAQDRLEEIEKELSNVSTEEKELRRLFLSTAAKAAILQERIKGRSLLSDSQGRVTAGIPSLKVELHLLDGSDGAFYSQEVKRFRQESPAQSFSQTITGRRDILVQERGKLEKSLQGEPVEEAERLLTRLIPPPPSEPAEVASSQPKSHPAYRSKPFEKDYDKIGPVDYGEGESLPYKGINEVLRDRANS